MTARSASPTNDEVRHAIATLTDTTGKPPSVLALAKYCGIANTTFRRQYPQITAELKSDCSTEPGRQDDQHSSPYQELKNRNAKLRREVENLHANLELAAANIQRLTLEVHRLRQERDEASRVTSITRARQQRDTR